MHDQQDSPCGVMVWPQPLPLAIARASRGLLGASSTSLASRLNAEICLNLKAKTLRPHVVGSGDSDLKKKEEEEFPDATCVHFSLHGIWRSWVHGDKKMVWEIGYVLKTDSCNASWTRISCSCACTFGRAKRTWCRGHGGLQILGRSLKLVQFKRVSAGISMFFKSIASKITKNLSFIRLLQATCLWDERRGWLALGVLCPHLGKIQRLKWDVSFGALSSLPLSPHPTPTALLPLSFWVCSGQEMFLHFKMIHLVIVRGRVLLCPPKKCTGVRNILIMSQHLGFYHFPICLHNCSSLKNLLLESVG